MLKVNASFFEMIELLREMLIELNMMLLILGCHNYQEIHFWVDLVGDNRKKRKGGELKIALIELLASTDKVMRLELNRNQLVEKAKQVQNWIKYFRQRKKKNLLHGWQKSMFFELESAHKIKIL